MGKMTLFNTLMWRDLKPGKANERQVDWGHKTNLGDPVKQTDQ